MRRRRVRKNQIGSGVGPSAQLSMQIVLPVEILSAEKCSVLQQYQAALCGCIQSLPRLYRRGGSGGGVTGTLSLLGRALMLSVHSSAVVKAVLSE